MTPLLKQIGAFLLVPCLIADPTTAFAMVQAPASAALRSSPSPSRVPLFAEQALELPDLLQMHVERFLLTRTAFRLRQAVEALPTVVFFAKSRTKVPTEREITYWKPVFNALFEAQSILQRYLRQAKPGRQPWRPETVQGKIDNAEKFLGQATDQFGSKFDRNHPSELGLAAEGMIKEIRALFGKVKAQIKDVQEQPKPQRLTPPKPAVDPERLPLLIDQAEAVIVRYSRPRSLPEAEWDATSKYGHYSYEDLQSLLTDPEAQAKEKLDGFSLSEGHSYGILPENLEDAWADLLILRTKLKRGRLSPAVHRGTPPAVESDAYRDYIHERVEYLLNQFGANYLWRDVKYMAQVLFGNRDILQTIERLRVALRIPPPTASRLAVALQELPVPNSPAKQDAPQPQIVRRGPLIQGNTVPRLGDIVRIDATTGAADRVNMTFSKKGQSPVVWSGVTAERLMDHGVGPEDAKETILYAHVREDILKKIQQLQKRSDVSDYVHPQSGLIQLDPLIMLLRENRRFIRPVNALLRTVHIELKLLDKNAVRFSGQGNYSAIFDHRGNFGQGTLGAASLENRDIFQAELIRLQRVLSDLLARSPDAETLLRDLQTEAAQIRSVQPPFVRNAIEDLTQRFSIPILDASEGRPDWGELLRVQSLITDTLQGLQLLSKAEPLPVFEVGPKTQWTVDWRALGKRRSAATWTAFWSHPRATWSEYTGDVGKFWEGIFSVPAGKDAYPEILDIGTGNFTIARVAKRLQRSAIVHAVDIATPPIDRIPWGVHFHRQGAEALEFDDHSMDTVVSMHGLEYSDLTRSLPEMNRVMRPGGRGVFILHSPDDRHVLRARDLLDQVTFLDQLQLMEHVDFQLHQPQSLPEDEMIHRLMPLQQEIDRRDKTGEPNDFLQWTLSMLEGVLSDSARSGPEEALKELRYWTEYFQTILPLSHELVRAATKLPDLSTVRQLFLEQGFVVDVLEPFQSEKGLEGWQVEIHKPEDHPKTSQPKFSSALASAA